MDRLTARMPGTAPARRRCSAGAVALLCGALAGCGSVQVRYPDGRAEYRSREDFAAYVERVFRYHNRVVNDLIVATSFAEEGSLDDGGLVGAEAAMASACRPLNEAVSASIEGREIGLFHRLTLPEAVPACEAASTRVKALLPAF